MHLKKSLAIATVVAILPAGLALSSGGCTLLEDSATDASVEAAPLVPIDAAPGGCQPNEAIASFVFDYKPPVHVNVCTEADVADLEASCFSARSTDATCAQWKSAGGACRSCVFTPDTAPAWGAFVQRSAPAVAASVNWGGAFEILHGASPACAAAEQHFQECDTFACSTAEACASATASQFQSCRERAVDGTCASAWQASSAACAAPADKAAIDHDLQIFDVVRALCGPPRPVDGGLDADAADASHDAPADG